MPAKEHFFISQNKKFGWNNFEFHKKFRFSRNSQSNFCKTCFKRNFSCTFCFISQADLKCLCSDKVPDPRGLLPAHPLIQVIVQPQPNLQGQKRIHSFFRRSTLLVTSIPFFWWFNRIENRGNLLIFFHRTKLNLTVFRIWIWFAFDKITF